jgi:hypothetical protein
MGALLIRLTGSQLERTPHLIQEDHTHGQQQKLDGSCHRLESKLEFSPAPVSLTP